MGYLKKIRIITLIMLLFSTLQAGGETYSANTPLAVVNGNNITLGHVIAAVARLPKEYDNLEPDYLLNGILDQLIKQEIMAQSLDVSKVLNNTFIENETRSIKAKYAVEAQMEGFPTADLIESAYKDATLSIENIEEFNASHILVETEADAVEIFDLLKSGVDFSELAQQKSTGPSGSNGGQLGWFGLGQMVPEFEAAVMVLEIGKISQPVKTQFGWHVIKLNDQRAKPLPTIDELKPDLVQKLNQDRIDALVEKETLKANIELFDTAIKPESIRDLTLLDSNN